MLHLWQGGLLAVLLLWLVGAYNRLMRLRNAVDAAWGLIDDALQRRAGALEPLIEALRAPLADEATTLAAVGQALEAQRLAAFAVKGRPSDAGRLATWVAAEAALASPLSRLRALIELHADLAQSATVTPRLAVWAECEPLLAHGRLGYNSAAAAYNQALLEQPTRLLTRVLGFRASGRA